MQDKYDDHRQVLDKSIRIVERGWCRHKLFRRHHGKTHCCLLGALNEAMRDFPLKRGIQIRDALVPAIERKTYSRLDKWNDNQRTKAPVIKLLKEVKEEFEVQAK